MSSSQPSFKLIPTNSNSLTKKFQNLQKALENFPSPPLCKLIDQSSTTSPRKPSGQTPQMETSEKRKERLKAMRLEADAVSHNDTSVDVPSYLSNPLADDNVAQEEPCAPSRFGFYTDPMAGFSSDTKRCKVGDGIPSNSFRHSDTGGLPMPRLPPPPPGIPRNPEMAPPPHQFQSNYSPDHRMYQQNFVPQRSPTGVVRPFVMHHGNPPEVWNGAESYNFPSDPSREGRFPGPRFRPPASPGFRPPGSPGFGPPASPGFRPPGSPGFGQQGNPGFRPPGSPGFGPPGSPGFRAPGSPRFGPPGSPGFGSNTRQGRGHWLSHSPSPHSVHGGSYSPSSSSGRGRGRFGSGGRGGRGRGSHDGPFIPELFYNASMVEEDPWKGLSPVTWQALPPVIWKGVDSPFNGNKNKASGSGGANRSTPRPNLAEYLAASLNETINEAPTS